MYVFALHLCSVGTDHSLRPIYHFPAASPNGHEPRTFRGMMNGKNIVNRT